ncbi:MAG TPA: response regulator transcription factor [Negativicutes bacterium]|nr:response regulator transcription factor [Negativicutes bacterium]
MLRVVLVDDERCVLEELAYRLDGKASIIGKFTNSFAAVAAIVDLKPDAVFLDIEMPELNGLEAAAEILALLPATVILFVTAYSHHAVEAFELNAVDYLVKPVQPQRLEKALERIARRVAEGRSTSEANKLKNWLQSELTTRQPEKISLWNGHYLEFVSVKAIAGCFVAKGERNVSVVVDGHIFHAAGSLNEFMTKIGKDHLLRCHRSSYLNPCFLARIERGRCTMNAYLEGYPDPVPVSRSYRKKILESLFQR